MNEEKAFYSQNNGNGYYTGIQTNLEHIDISAKTLSLLSHLTNNLGDCYEQESCPLPNTMHQERAAVEHMAEWLSLPANECWGYVGGGRRWETCRACG